MRTCSQAVVPPPSFKLMSPNAWVTLGNFCKWFLNLFSLELLLQMPNFKHTRDRDLSSTVAALEEFVEVSSCMIQFCKYPIDTEKQKYSAFCTSDLVCVGGGGVGGV